LTPDRHFDLVVVGSGPAGEKGATQAAYFGKKVALIERAPRVGGASVHTGTLPSKTLRETALYLTGFRRRELYGMSLRLDRKKSLRQLVGRLQDVTDRQTRQIERNFQRHGIELIAGNARFEDSTTLGCSARSAPSRGSPRTRFSSPRARLLPPRHREATRTRGQRPDPDLDRPRR
jgi:NAD(P) transhydrogenase